MQKLIITGNLTKDPERVIGLDMVKMVVAENDLYTKADGTKPVQYFNVIAWGKIADNCEQYLTKGSKVLVVGRIQTRSWTDDSGNKKYIQEVICSEIEFLSIKKE